jgi:hypothetical protein
MKSLYNTQSLTPVVRLIVEAICPICGPLTDAPAEGIVSLILAHEHTAATAHVVIFNGSTDLPEITDEGHGATALIPAQWGQA